MTATVKGVYHMNNAVRIPDEENKFMPSRKTVRKDKIWLLKRNYGLLLIGSFILAAYTILICCVTGTIAHHNAWEEANEVLSAEYAAKLEAYKQEQARAAQAAHFLSGDASREAAINQAVDAVAGVISKLSTDAQKLTEASCILARVMSPLYPNSFQEVVAQEQQWMFYDGSDKKFSAHDRELADQIVRPYMESGIVPNGLTDKMVYGEWTPSDFVLRDSYKTTSTMYTWRYQG